MTSSHLPFDTPNLPQRIEAVRALEKRLAYLSPLISAIEDRLSQLTARSDALNQLIDAVAA
jgi:prefoldin subunit 5